MKCSSRIVRRRLPPNKTRDIARLWLAVLLAITASLGLRSPAAQAHSPHDIIRAVAISPNYANDQTVFLITSTPGWWKPTDLYRSVDGGVSWHSITNGLDHRREAVDIKLSPDYAADGTAFIATEGDGVYRSTDHAASWSASNTGLGALYVSHLAVSPSFATDRTLLTAGTFGGLFRSQDGGESWTSVFDAATKFASLAFASAENGKVVAFAGDSSGAVHRSEDGGRTWQREFNRPEMGAVHVIAPSPDFASDGAYFVGTEKLGLWRAVDGALLNGASERFTALPGAERDAPDSPHALCCSEANAASLAQSAGVYLPVLSAMTDVNATAAGLDIRAVSVSPDFAQDETVLAAARKRLAFRTRNGGNSWHAVGAEAELTHPQADEYGMPDFYDLALSPAFATDRTVFLAGFNGLFKSEDGGTTWEQLETLANGLPTGLSVSPNFANDGQVAAVTQHAGTLVSHNRGDSWETWNRGLLDGRIYGIEHSPDFANDAFFFTFERGGIRRVTDKTTDYDWDAWSFGLRPPDPESGETVSVNFPEASAISPDFAADGSIFIGARHYGLYDSHDGGRTWELLWEQKYSPVAFAISPDYADDRTLFVSILNDGLFKSSDAGENWTNVMDAAPWLSGSSVDEFPYWHYIIYPAISPNFANDGTIFAGASDGLFKSEDGGESWDEVPDFMDRFIMALALSPDYAADPTLLVSVKGLGLFKSEDGGETFSPIAPDLLRDHHLLRNIRFADDQTVFAYADHLLRSDDGGHTWRLLTTPIRYENHKHPVHYYGDWARRNDLDSSMSSYSFSAQAGHHAVLDFAGTGVSWIGAKDDNLGIANVYVDGVLEATVDQYAATPQREAVLFSVLDLPPGPHTITVEVTGQRNPASTSARITLDAFDVTGFETASRLGVN